MPWYNLMGAVMEVLMTLYQNQFLLICSYHCLPPPPDRRFYWEGWRAHTHTHKNTSTDGENLSELWIYTVLLDGGRISGMFPAIYWPSVCLPAGVAADKSLPVFALFFFFLCWSRFNQEMRRKQGSRNSVQISTQEIMFQLPTLKVNQMEFKSLWLVGCIRCPSCQTLDAFITSCTF